MTDETTPGTNPHHSSPTARNNDLIPIPPSNTPRALTDFGNLTPVATPRASKRLMRSSEEDWPQRHRGTETQRKNVEWRDGGHTPNPPGTPSRADAHRSLSPNIILLSVTSVTLWPISSRDAGLATEAQRGRKIEWTPGRCLDPPGSPSRANAHRSLSPNIILLSVTSVFSVANPSVSSVESAASSRRCLPWFIHALQWRDGDCSFD